MIKVIIGSTSGRKSYMIDENTSIYDALVKGGITPGRGFTTLDSVPVTDLNMTFADFGVGESCMLYNTVKADNAVNVTVAGGAVVFASALKLEDIEDLVKYAPEALVLKDENGDEVFAVGLAKDGHGSIGAYGVSYAKTGKTADGFATVTICAPEKDANAIREAIADTYGPALAKINQIETAAAEKLVEARENHRAVVESITIA